MKHPDGPPPYLPYPWHNDAAGTAAIKALDRGAASPEQQRLALDTIITGLCAYYDLSYRPNSDRDTAFAEGKRFIGAQLVKLTRLNIRAINHALKGEPTEQP